ncbi:MAG: transcriptional regulator [Candidatus Methanomethylicota archaeon]|nr:MAG: transcriptional regulator [Candidatus Verstraetearchaeota archaeon]
MNKDQAVGALLLVGGIIGIIIYGWLLITYPLIMLQLTAFIAVAAVGLIIAWIGYTLATTPPPKPMEEIEKELEEELKTLEEEEKEEKESETEKKEEKGEK